MPEQGLEVVIVSWRCERMLRDALQSLRNHPPSRPMSVHVVDNASRDGTATMVAREFPEVTLTVNDENLGFSAANNIALRASRSKYALVLNPDTRVTEGGLDALLTLMDAKPEVGLCGPRLELEDGSFDHASRRSFPTPLSAFGHFTGIGRRLRSGPLAAYRAPEVAAGSIDAVNGAFMLLRRRALDQVGLFDEGYWMYMEDLDLCYRLKQAGWVTWYEPTVRMIHIKAGTSGEHRSLRLNYAFHYGMYRFFRDHYGASHWFAYNAIVYAGIIARFLTVSMRDSLSTWWTTRLRARLRTTTP